MAAASNHLIELLPSSARRRLLAQCELVDLVVSETLCKPGTPTQHVYFPTEGFISLLALNDDDAALEVGMVGREGMLGAQLVPDVSTVPSRALVQGPGRVWRIGRRTPALPPDRPAPGALAVDEPRSRRARPLSRDP